jgi:peptide/nickel transport system permease protein
VAARKMGNHRGLPLQFACGFAALRDHQSMSLFNALRKRFRNNRLALASLIIVILLIAMAVSAPWIAPYDPNQPDMQEILSLPTSRHLLGTDQLGRDLLSRIIWGARISLQVGVIAVGLAFFLGTALGMFGAYWGKWSDEASMRIVDIMLSFPMILLAICLIAFLGSSLTNVMLAVGVSLSPRFARIARSLTLSVKEQVYIDAARALGAGSFRICFRHVLPNIFSPLLVTATLYISTAILIESSLSYLGLGVQPPDPTWGSIINEGREVLRINPWISTYAGVMIMITILSFNILGDTLRDFLDPRFRRQI